MKDRIRSIGRFFAELKRRKVYRVAVVYIVVAVGAIELLDTIIPATRLPDWADELFLALVLLGLPLAIVLAWAFDLTPDGLSRTGKADGPDTAAAGRASDELPLRERAVAVLPFDSFGEETSTAFNNAIHGDVLTRLSTVSDLLVISRTSVLQYRNAAKPLPAIARELGVRWVLTGEVQEIAGRVQVNARLLDAGNDRQVWAEKYQRELTADHIFDIQSDITRQIIAALAARLTRGEAREVERAPTGDLEAYRLNSQGRRSLDQRTEEGMRRAVAHFQAAIERDPEYALAYVGLADALALLFDYSYEPARSTLLEAEDAVRRALDLEPQLAEAHASLGLIHSNRREGPAAIRELTRAVELRPGYAEAYNWLSWVHVLLGHTEEALASARRAIELDPLSPESISNLALSQLASGVGDLGLAEARRGNEIEPAFTTLAFYEGLALYHLGRFQEAQAVLEGVRAPWAGEGPRATLALAYAAAGETDHARTVLADVEDSGDRFAAALVRAALGEHELALEQLDGFDDWDPWPCLAVHHLYPDVLGPLRERPRFQSVLESLNRSWGMTEG